MATDGVWKLVWDNSGSVGVSKPLKDSDTLFRLVVHIFTLTYRRTWLADGEARLCVWCQHIDDNSSAVLESWTPAYLVERERGFSEKTTRVTIHFRFFVLSLPLWPNWQLIFYSSATFEINVQGDLLRSRTKLHLWKVESEIRRGIYIEGHKNSILLNNLARLSFENHLFHIHVLCSVPFMQTMELNNLLRSIVFFNWHHHLIESEHAGTFWPLVPELLLSDHQVQHVVFRLYSCLTRLNTELIKPPTYDLYYRHVKRYLVSLKVSDLTAKSNVWQADQRVQFLFHHTKKKNSPCSESPL